MWLLSDMWMSREESLRNAIKGTREAKGDPKAYSKAMLKHFQAFVVPTIATVPVVEDFTKVFDGGLF